MHRGIPICMIVLFFLVPASPASAQHCDPDVPVSSNYALRYHQRGSPEENSDRCEGLFVQEVSSRPLEVASFTWVFETYEPVSDDHLTVTWETPNALRAHLQGLALRHNLYYRMDTTRPADSTSFRWDTVILANFNISRNDLGVIGWVERDERKVYLPLRITRGPTATRSDQYRLVLMPGQELQEVYVSIATVDSTGNPASFLPEYDGKALDYGYYPAQQPIDLDLPLALLPQAGMYYVEVVARFKRGGSTATDFWFYHPGSKE